MSTLSGAETARKRFLLWEMGFPDAKISTRSRRARRFCRFPKSSKSVGLGRLENPLGFQPSRRERFLCERASVLSRSPGGFGGVRRVEAMLRPSHFCHRWDCCFNFRLNCAVSCDFHAFLCYTVPRRVFQLGNRAFFAAVDFALLIRDRRGVAPARTV